MSRRVTLLPQHIEFDVPVGSTILQAAHSNNIDFPSRCQVGQCAMCMCRLISGEISYKLDPVLTEKEIEKGWMFPCQAFAETDLKLTFEE